MEPGGPTGLRYERLNFLLRQAAALRYVCITKLFSGSSSRSLLRPLWCAVVCTAVGPPCEQSRYPTRGTKCGALAGEDVPLLPTLGPNFLLKQTRVQAAETKRREGERCSSCKPPRAGSTSPKAALNHAQQDESRSSIYCQTHKTSNVCCLISQQLLSVRTDAILELLVHILQTSRMLHRMRGPSNFHK